MLKINGVAIATPKVYEVTITDIDGETNRNLKGDLTRDRVAVKRKINLEWPTLSQSQISALLKSVRDTFFTVEFIDPMEGVLRKTMYVGDRTSPALRVIEGEVRWSGLKMNFIEK